MYDFCIIGGGIAGISLSAALAPHGTVLLLEAEDALAYHASGRSAALFIEDYGNKTIRALNSASKPLLDTIDGGVLSPRGMMMLARHGEEAEFKKEARAFRLDGISITEAVDKVPLLDPAKLTAAAYRADPSDIDTDRLIQTYFKTARANGAQILTHQQVIRCARPKDYWQITTQADHFTAKTIINAAGAWADQIASLCGIIPLGLIPHRRSIARLPLSIDCSSWPALDGVNETWYAKPDAGQMLVSPADATPVSAHDAWADDITIAQGIDHFQSIITEDITHLTTTWAGLRTFAPDSALVIGRARSEPSFFWLAGQGGYGFQTAPAASTLAAELLLDMPLSLDKTLCAALSPERFTT